MQAAAASRNTAEVVANENAELAAVDSPEVVVDLSFSETVSGHINRPYQESKLLIKEIINSDEPIPDPQGTNA
ncbi:MAG: hypothetical protein E7275_05875 [Pseudobutyrivibrio sp.]|jgi:hypothetical protein|uniref:hypothetical protein n=1 Tax=Pseudobutyrivibrio sp. TaxID=2014367 RepID=UPI0025DE9921|nr:hypothetical protein [Pseudobutyrivibrio sp.]MBE5903801.1 hypothetical protein [Pseudobutyrivibrio sp.]